MTALLFIAWCLQSQTEPHAGTEEKVRAFLGAIDRPVSDESWRQLGPEVVPVLVAIVADKTEFPSRRANAANALRALAAAEQAPLLHAIAQKENEPWLLRQSALSAAILLSAAEQRRPKLQVILEGAKEARFRQEAARQLFLIKDDKACSLVASQAARENTKNRSVLERLLLSCRR